MTARRAFVDARDLARMLNAQAESLCRQILPDGRREGHEWVARVPWRADGKIGSFSVHLTGAKAGIWADFADGQARGDALDLVSWVCCGQEKAAAVQWALRYLGLAGGDPKALEVARAAIPSQEVRDAEQLRQEEETRASARRIWFAGAKQLIDTPVERYLRGRGIALREMGRTPGAIRFHPELWNVETKRKWPAMVTAIASVGVDGGFYAVHRTWLEVMRDGAVRKAPLEKNKKVLGLYRAGHMPLWRGASGKPLKAMPEGEIVDISEGVEDGLSVAFAAPNCRVVAAISLSNLAALALPEAAKTVRLWRQNDTNATAIGAFDRAVRAHLAAGRQVLIPDIPGDVKDVNDMLVSCG
ncbi:TOPRIM domain containing protein [uncultured Caudovirales phage]|uniref:TOPRIM domain containing protein n=1 Tax=uncultured Caudovirales phage TaxID=2100421 RepID=A0A6J5P7R9_9CAUD|nr:TOPRIM domain containing protein [uncultured Caudovirales phage]CAB4172463.1 TOPRIM domain containing protein [uncultured Caudovirales phage]